MKYYLDVRYSVWNNDCGERIEVGEDPDGLDLTEIVWVSDDNQRGTNICFTDEAIPLLIEALTARLNRKK